MNRHRLGAVFRLKLSHHARRPMLWVLVAILALISWGLSTGTMTISSGDTAIGGTKAWITSEFSNAFLLSAVIFLVYSFFVAIASGLAVLRDEDAGVSELLHATPLTAGEYIWGNFLAVLAAFGGVMTLHMVLAAFFNHVVPNAHAAEIRGPFVFLNYLVPFAVFGIPSIVFLAGTTFAIGERTRQPLLIYLLPLGLLLFCGTLLWSFSPPWLDPRFNRLLMLIDPAGFRWLNETWLKVDRGVAFYNQGRIVFDLPFLLSRLGFIAAGLGAVAYSSRRFAATLRGRSRRMKRRASRELPVRHTPPVQIAGAPLARLEMRSKVPGFLRATANIFRMELRELVSRPGPLLLLLLILTQVASHLLMRTGPMQMPTLLTPGLTATHLMLVLTIGGCLMLLFYTVESMIRAARTGLAPILNATPVRSGSIVLGNALTSGLLAVVLLLGSGVICWVAILLQGKVPFHITPYLVVWGLLIFPTFILWTAFTAALFALTRSRGTTYAVALAAFAITIYLELTGAMSWTGNWNLWHSVLWSDMGPLQLDRTALILNRLTAVFLAGALFALAAARFPRVKTDPVQIFGRLRRTPLRKRVFRVVAVLLPATVCWTMLAAKVHTGFQGGIAKRRAKEYWRRNLATWRDVPSPDLTAVDLKIRIDPQDHAFTTEGTYRLVNGTGKPMPRFALTGGFHWRDVRWTLDGQPFTPDDRSSLYVFAPSVPLAPGEGVTVGFTFEGHVPDGISKNGGPLGEFILPSGAVLTSFSTSFAPLVGYREGIGVDDDNEYDPKEYPDDFYVGITPAALGSNTAFSTRIAVTVPEGWTANSVGVLAGTSVHDGMRTFLWKSDHPVRFFNIIAGRWALRRGHGTAVYFHPSHTTNIATISAALDAARRYYSQWFSPYPWKELRISEFPALAGYAQGFPTNISFSEGIGFLTASSHRYDLAFAVTAHEASHQWWGSIITPGRGPGADVLTEGLAQFSAALLLEQVKGPFAAAQFRRWLEEEYDTKRQKDSERPLVRIDGSRAGDTAAIYDKGGWVFWMLTRLMGRDAAFAGFHDFIGRYKDGPDFPVLHDLLSVMREHAPNPATFDAFTSQWFDRVVLPRYRIVTASRTRTASGWTVRATVSNDGSGTMPIEIAAASGDRTGPDGGQRPDYRDARTTLILKPSQTKTVLISCPFKPALVLVDPDVTVLQLDRKKALRRF